MKANTIYRIKEHVGITLFTFILALIVIGCYMEEFNDTILYASIGIALFVNILIYHDIKE